MFLRREAEPPHHRLLDLADHVAADQAAQRVRLAGQFGRAQRAEVEVPPPGRLVLPPVPVEQVGQQRPRLPSASPRKRPAQLARRPRNAGQQRRPDPGDLGVLGGTRLLREDRPRQVLAQPLGQLGPPFLQPVPQRQRGPAVVLVVPGHDPLPLPITGRGPVLERRLQRDQAGRRLVQVHLPVVSAQRLQPLDRVALHPGPHALPHDPVQVGEHPQPEQVVHLVLVRGETAHQPPTASWRVPCSSVRWSIDVGS